MLGDVRDRWRKLAEWPLMIAALLFLIVYALPILTPDLDRTAQRACSTVAWITWGLFALDYLVRLVLARRRLSFIGHNFLDLIIVVLPLLRPLRLLRLLTLLNFLNRSASAAFRGRVVVYVGGATALLLFVSSLAMLDAERDQSGATINNYGDALWWAITTMTTVGYGDRYPVTGTGRLVAAALMLGGIALLGVVTATLASWIVERVSESEVKQQAATRAQVNALHFEIAALRSELRIASSNADPLGSSRPVINPDRGPSAVRGRGGL